MARGGAKYGRGAGVAAIRNLGEYKAKRARAATRTRAIKGAIDTGAAVATTAIGAMGKAETAWGEYEAGYKELGGDVANIEKPGFFKRTAQQILPGGKTGLPEGDVTINKKIYDRAQIQKAGAFLGSDASAILDEDTRKQYLERTAPGRTEATTFTQGIGDKKTGGGVTAWSLTGGGTGGRFSQVTPSTSGGGSSVGVGTGFGGGIGSNVQHELAGKDFQPFQNPFRIRYTRGQEVNDITPKTIESGSQIPEQNMPLHALSSKEVGEKKAQEQQWSNMEMEYGNIHTPKSAPWLDRKNIPSYAGGGDFITNGPQKILVGDNASGRERVTIKPLPSKNEPEITKQQQVYMDNPKRNAWDTQILNNKNRKP